MLIRLSAHSFSLLGLLLCFEPMKTGTVEKKAVLEVKEGLLTSEKILPDQQRTFTYLVPNENIGLPKSSAVAKIFS